MFDLYRAEDFIEQQEILLKLRKMNKLDEIIEKIDEDFYKKESYYLSQAEPELFSKQVALEFAKHILEEAAENAKIKGEWENLGGNAKILGSYRKVFKGYIVKKQSITDTLNKYL